MARQPTYRLRGGQGQVTLVGTRCPASCQEFYLTPPPESAAEVEPSGANFVTECFFVTQVMVHTALMPAGGLRPAAQSGQRL